MRVLVTVRSIVSAAQHCVAGLDESLSYRRFLAASGHHRSPVECDRDHLRTGLVVNAAGAPESGKRPPPHGAEDTWIRDAELEKSLEAARFHAVLERAAKSSVREAFGDNLEPTINGQFSVRVGTEARSLGLIGIRGSKADFELVRKPDKTFQKRISFETRERSLPRKWSVPITSVGLSRYWDQIPGDPDSRVRELNRRLASCERLYLQIGLANPVDDGLCYAMAVGVSMVGVDGAPLS